MEVVRRNAELRVFDERVAASEEKLNAANDRLIAGLEREIVATNALVDYQAQEISDLKTVCAMLLLRLMGPAALEEQQ